MSEPRVSFEFFPPKTEAMNEQLEASIDKLAPLAPSFVSVTYGAGGSTRERTHAVVEKIVKRTNLQVAAHLTTISAARGEVDDVLRRYWESGVRHIVALRGDPEGGVGEAYVPDANGYAGAAELCKGARNIAPFEITVGCYPEKHPESASFDHDIDLLKRKIDNGATRAITQFFYDNDVYERYLERVRAAGIDIPIVPGIMPVTNFKAVRRMAKLCAATVPERYGRLFDHLEDDPKTRQLVAATVAAEQCWDLKARGVEEFHFYTLNRSELAFALCHMLGVRPQAERKAA
ncbi:methylenetetrahydrofolate reductase [NAD(P)H] [Parvularcula maris]|uniref:Methylenetetrahydrofolate reductase n=1 Tax=Parvularcula maris TaxID=2965077 RepID=A0A9X2L7C5_9PROT|nr:methylenetetrahydrofolate reductase [NAD(P)H] [Parvularcula maris]MCQ8184433.1 methylenetetrahydrofolate reductase [NAD(P)H] [Parvularcula maris]